VVTCATSIAEGLATDLVAHFEDNVAKWSGGAGSLRMAIAVVGTEGIKPDATDGEAQLAGRMAAALRAAKQGDGSNYVVWTPGTP